MQPGITSDFGMEGKCQLLLITHGCDVAIRGRKYLDLRTCLLDVWRTDEVLAHRPIWRTSASVTKLPSWRP